MRVMRQVRLRLQLAQYPTAAGRDALAESESSFFSSYHGQSNLCLALRLRFVPAMPQLREWGGGSDQPSVDARSGAHAPLHRGRTSQYAWR